MARSTSEQADGILDQSFQVLDKGFVRLVDYMGTDERIVQAARVSYGAGTKTYREDRGLIRYLLRNEHTSPFEQVVFTFHIKMPIFVARQWLRHRTARLNEISGRYSVMKPEFYVPAVEHIAEQSSDNKQGRSAEPLSADEARGIRSQLERGHTDDYQTYEALLDQGLARELARINLPLSLYTEMYWQIDLHNLLHFLKLRLDSHAQLEIREYAQVLRDIAAKVCPIAVEAFEDFITGSYRMSAPELAALRALLQQSGLGEEELQAAAQEHGLSKRDTARFVAGVLGT